MGKPLETFAKEKLGVRNLSFSSQEIKHQKTDQRDQRDFFFNSPDAEKVELPNGETISMGEAHHRSAFNIGVLGGKQGSDMGRELGYSLTKDFFSVRTGGYKFDVMGSALDGANNAIEEMKSDPKLSKVLDQAMPHPKGFVAERIIPTEYARGKHVAIEIADTVSGGVPLDTAERLQKLIEGTDVDIVLPGDSGTELEVYMNLHFEQKVKGKVGLPSRPVVFVGNHHEALLKAKYPDIIAKSETIFRVESSEEATELVKKLFYLRQEEEEFEAIAIKLEEIEKKLKMEARERSALEKKRESLQEKLTIQQGEVAKRKEAVTDNLMQL